MSVIVFFEVIPERTIWSIPIKPEEEHMLAVPVPGGWSVRMQKREQYQTETKEQEYEKQNHGRTRILIVDGDPDVAFTFKVALENYGFKDRVDAYNDPVLALTNFRPQYYGLAILDIDMYKMNGFQLFDVLKKLDDELDVLFSSAFESNNEEFIRLYQSQVKSNFDADARLRDSGDRFIKKPIDIEDLVRSVTAEKR